MVLFWIRHSGCFRPPSRFVYHQNKINKLSILFYYNPRFQPQKSGKLFWPNFVKIGCMYDISFYSSLCLQHFAANIILLVLSIFAGCPKILVIHYSCHTCFLWNPKFRTFWPYIPKKTAQTFSQKKSKAQEAFCFISRKT